MSNEQVEMDDDMNDENKDQAPVADPVAVTILKETSEAINNASGEIRKRVIDHFAGQKIDERVDLLTRALKNRDDKWKEIQKMRPDQVQYDESGKEVNSFWSKEQSEKRKGLLKSLNKMDRAINRAVNDADYEGLRKFT